MDGWTEERMEGRTDGLKNRWRNERKEGWRDGGKNGWTDRVTNEAWMYARREGFPCPISIPPFTVSLTFCVVFSFTCSYLPIPTSIPSLPPNLITCI